MQKFSVDLTNCDREPIHIPNKIQPFGCLFVLSAEDLSVLQCSENTDDFFGFECKSYLHKDFRTYLPDGFKINFLSELKSQSGTIHKNIPLQTRGGFEVFACSFYKHKEIGSLILQVERVEQEQNFLEEAFAKVEELSDRLRKITSPEELFDETAVAFKELLNFDRVMVYRFDEDWHGQVVAESKTDKHDSFLWQHFPASDIPKQARELYRRNVLRVLPDTDYKAAPLYPELNPLNDSFLDLSDSFLRSVSPIHIEYLKNMKVRATCVMSILIGDEFIGMVSCHHYSPHRLSYPMRVAAKQLLNIVSLKVHEIREKETLEHYDELKSIAAAIILKASNSEDVIEFVNENLSELMKLNNSCGISIYIGNRISAQGKTLNPKMHLQLIEFLDTERSNENVFYTNELPKLLNTEPKKLNGICGLLSVRVASNPTEYIFWFLPEKIDTKFWAGNPNEKIIMKEDAQTIRLSPRKSFEKWKEVVHGKSVSWASEEIRIAGYFRNNFIEMKAAQHTRLAALSKELRLRVAEKTQDLRVALEELKMLNEELSANNEELQITSADLDKQNQRLREIAHLQSHVVRKPVANIKGLAAILKSDLPADEVKVYIEHILKSTEELDSIIHEIVRKTETL